MEEVLKWGAQTSVLRELLQQKTFVCFLHAFINFAA